MDSHSLAMEMAPVIMWREDNRPESYREYWRRPSRSPKKSNDFETATPWDLLSGKHKNTWLLYSLKHSFITIILLFHG